MGTEVKNTLDTYLGPDYQQKVLWQLLVEPDFCQNVIDSIEVDYFDDPYLKRLFIIMFEYYKEHGKVPNLQNESIYSAIHKHSSSSNGVEGEVLKGKLDQIKLWNERVINKNLLYDGDVVRTETVNFIKQQEYRKLGEHIINKVKTGEIKKSTFNFEVEEKINKIYHIGDEEEYGSDVVDDIDIALSKEFRQTIPTGIAAIDAVTGNGLGKGEIGLILAPSGVGKSTALTKIANTAFNDGKRVLQIIFEDTVPQIQRKHFAIWSQVPLSDMDERRDIVKERVLERVAEKKKEGGKIDIIKFDDEMTTLHDIRNWIARQYKKRGYHYDIIVLDYLDCLEPNRRENDLHTAELSVVKSFIAMAAEYDIPCWSAIQTNRSGFNVDFVEAHNSGGNIKRIQKSHFVMTISKPDKTAAIANIKIVKARFASDGQEYKDCIFDNNTLEIRMTESQYSSGLKTSTYSNEDALNKTEDVALKLSTEYHAKVSSMVGEQVSGETISNVVNSPKVELPNEGLTENTEFETKKEVDSVGEKLIIKKEYPITESEFSDADDKNDDSVTTVTENPTEIVEEKTHASIENNNVASYDEFLSDLELDNDIVEDEGNLNFINSLRESQGPIIVE